MCRLVYLRSTERQRGEKREMRVTEAACARLCAISVHFWESASLFLSIPFKGIILKHKDFDSKSLAQAQTRQISSLIGLNNSEGYLVFDCSIL